MMRALYGCLIAILMATAASADTLPSATPPEIVGGVRSCLAATGSQGTDIAKLTQDGWTAVSMSPAQDSTKAPARMLSKGNLLLVHDVGARAPICAIMARVEGIPAVGDIATAMDSDLKTARKGDGGKAVPAYWFPEGHIVELDTTGTEKTPGVRIVVGYRK